MSETLLSVLVLVVLLTIILTPITKSLYSQRKTYARRFRIKSAGERRDADIEQFGKFMKALPYRRYADYIKYETPDDVLKYPTFVSIAPFIKLFDDPEFFFFDGKVQKALDRLILSIYVFDSAQTKFFINAQRSGYAQNLVWPGRFEGRIDPAYSRKRLKIAADTVEKSYRDFVAIAEERLGKCA